MIGRVRIVVGVVAAVVALAGASPVWAKGDIPFRVVTPSGTAFWVGGAAAKAWWHDFDAAHTGDCSCMSAAGAARFTDQMMRRLGNHANGVDGLDYYVVMPRLGLPSIYYPATKTTPAYVMTPSGLGTARQSWNDWRVATSRMQHILASGSTAAANRAAMPTPATSNNGGTWLWLGIAGAVAACAAMIAAPRTRRLAGRVTTAWH